MEHELENVTDDEELMYFESDHLALRGNRQYGEVLRTFCMLQAQRLRVHKQIEELEDAKKMYLEQPELLLDKLQKNEPIIAPNYMSIVQLPEISFKQELEPSQTHNENVQVKTEANDISNSVNTTDNGMTVRGRHTLKSKSETFNRLWTNEEQRRLEQLLVEYPVEEVEMRRFTKIAKALGNRTPQQVSSRVQKYFQKLYEAGIPVPGRIPKYRRAGSTKQRNFYKPSTFFPQHNISMSMPEDDFMLDGLQGATDALLPIKTEIKEELNEPNASGEDLDHETNKSTRNLLNEMLVAIRDEKIKTVEGYNPDPLAARCADCKEERVARTRWHCNSCYCQINSLCLDCLVDQLLNKRFEHITHDVVLQERS